MNEEAMARVGPQRHKKKFAEKAKKYPAFYEFLTFMISVHTTGSYFSTTAISIYLLWFMRAIR